MLSSLQLPQLLLQTQVTYAHTWVSHLPVLPVQNMYFFAIIISQAFRNDVSLTQTWYGFRHDFSQHSKCVTIKDKLSYK